jgi:hypothetical protein
VERLTTRNRLALDITPFPIVTARPSFALAYVNAMGR